MTDARTHIERSTTLDNAHQIRFDEPNGVVRNGGTECGKYIYLLLCCVLRGNKIYSKLLLFIIRM